MGNDVLRALHEYLESAVHLTGSETYLRCQKVSERGNRLEVTGRKHVYWCTERNFRPFQSKCGNHGRNPRKACGKIFAVCVHSEQLNGEQMKMPKEMHSLYPGISWGELRQGIFRGTTIRRWEKQLEASDRTRRKASYNCSIQVSNLVPAPEVSVTAASQKTGRGQKEAWAGSREEAGHTSFREGIGPTRDSWRNKDESDIPEWRVKF